MILVREMENYHPDEKPLYLALGNFDGLHLGHRSLLEQLITKARQDKGVSAAFIFEPHPANVLSVKPAPKLLSSAERKAKMLEEMGLGLLIYHTFNLQIAQWNPEEFVEKVLVNQFKVREIFIGFNYSFGHRGTGTPETMQYLGQRFGFAVNIIPPVRMDGEIVSSTLIRKALDRGDIDTCKAMLGYYPYVEGIVSPGEGRGKRVGYPTANLIVDEKMNIPGLGVYAAQAVMKTGIYRAVINIGRKPTFHQEYPVTVEAHILDFHQDIYGSSLELVLLKKIRDERKFDRVEDLVAQIEKDRQVAIAFFAAHRTD